jgi:hypothetical protein
MPLPSDYATEAMYAPEAWFVHDLDVFADENRIVGHIDTNKLGTLAAAQRVWPQHPQHFPGAVAIQVTGVLGQLYAVYVLDLRATQGWVGFGTHIKTARFASMGVIGPPVRAHLEATSVRNIRGTIFTRYAFRFEQEDRVIYTSEQTAAWVRSDHRGPRPA